VGKRRVQCTLRIAARRLLLIKNGNHPCRGFGNWSIGFFEYLFEMNVERTTVSTLRVDKLSAESAMNP
jgi:hypothetical protein